NESAQSHSATRQPLECGNDVVDTHLAASSNIENLSCFVTEGGSDSPINSVINVGVIAKLLAVAIKFDHSILQTRSNEPMESHVWSLSWTVHREVADCHNWQTVAPPIQICEVFACKFCNTVRR